MLKFWIEKQASGSPILLILLFWAGVRWPVRSVSALPIPLQDPRSLICSTKTSYQFDLHA